jgi:hypothetical protein
MIRAHILLRTAATGAVSSAVSDSARLWALAERSRSRSARVSPEMG